jgi:NAD-dependent deacetylase
MRISGALSRVKAPVTVFLKPTAHNRSTLKKFHLAMRNQTLFHAFPAIPLEAMMQSYDAGRMLEPRRIFILTGAGVSVESGLDTFRAKGGLWSRYKLEDVASIEGYRRDPARVLEFYNWRRANLAKVRPNPAHRAQARLEAAWEERGGEVTLCTQNVDNLHERAGAKRVLHMHGELAKTRCHGCGAVTPDNGDLTLDIGCESCERTGLARPHVVWFGEIPLEMERIGQKLRAADLFVSMGTSGAVYPAAGFAREAQMAGIPAIEINLKPSDNARFFSAARYGKASEVAPVWVEELIGRAFKTPFSDAT